MIHFSAIYFQINIFYAANRGILLRGIMWILFVSLLTPGICAAQQANTRGEPWQDSTELTILEVDSSALDVHLDFIKYFPTTDSCIRYLNRLPTALIAKGYIAASIDTVIQEKPGKVLAKLYLGQIFRWKALQIPASERWILDKMRLQQPLEGKTLDPVTMDEMFQGILSYYLDHGYPFATIGLDSISFEKKSVRAILKVDKGPYYKMDSVVIQGSAKVSENFLQHYLSIDPEEPFNQSKLAGIDRLLANLPYVEVKKSTDIAMANDGAIIQVYLDKKLTNKIDAIIGFMPANGELGGKLQLTGQVALNLKNAFGGGEALDINWQQLQPQSPRIDLGFKRPYLFKSPFGIDLSFGLYKQDSAYVNVFGNIGTIYQFSAMRQGRVFVNFASSRLLDVDTLAIIASHELPEIMDVHSINLGFGYADNTTDYQFNPRRGNEFSATVLVGNKKVKKNNTISQITSVDSFDFASLYDTVQLKSYQITIKANWAHYLPVGKFGVLKTAVNGGLYQSPKVFTNEMFLIGGHRLLRGFDEESIYATAYGIGSVEYRYLIGRNSFFFGFSDFGWTSFKNSRKQYDDTHLSFGLGMAFETKAGIFNFSIASGKDQSNDFGLNKAKVHIGYTTLF